MSVVRVTLLADKGDYAHARFRLVDQTATDFEKQKAECAKAVGLVVASSDEEVELRSPRGVLFERSDHMREGDDVVVHVKRKKEQEEATEGNEGKEEEKEHEIKKVPREVTVSFFVNAVKSLDAIEGTVEVDFQLYLSWIDPALAGIAVVRARARCAGRSAAADMRAYVSAASLLCCAVLCCAVLCCAVLCCAVLCCAVLRCAWREGGSAYPHRKGTRINRDTARTRPSLHSSPRGNRRTALRTSRTTIASRHAGILRLVDGR